MIRIFRIWCMFIWMRYFIRISIKEKRFSVRKAGTIIWNRRKDRWNITVLYIMRWKVLSPHRMKFWNGRLWITFSLIPLMDVNQAVIRKIFRILPMRISWISTELITIHPTAIFICMEIWIWKRNWHSWMSIICRILIIWMWILLFRNRKHSEHARMWLLSIRLLRMREKRTIPIFLITWLLEMLRTVRWRWHLRYWITHC